MTSLEGQRFLLEAYGLIDWHVSRAKELSELFRFEVRELKITVSAVPLRPWPFDKARVGLASAG